MALPLGPTGPTRKVRRAHAQSGAQPFCGLGTSWDPMNPASARPQHGGLMLLSTRFDDLPIVGGWGRRPLELATLRLQNMKLSIDNWSELKPADDRSERIFLLY